MYKYITARTFTPAVKNQYYDLYTGRTGELKVAGYLKKVLMPAENRSEGSADPVSKCFA